jgi:hypothetical protein
VRCGVHYGRHLKLSETSKLCGVIQAERIDDKPVVALRPLCDALGINYASQYTKLKRKSWATVVLNTMVAADGISREC